ncbi:MAG: VWA domain-containing protein [Pseudomonadota bacterium]|nr:VWA domain-containing protein [Pseudomonadota bacterium]QKK06640.1 MAG: VWA domain-containing protein [Pseudomonadota bacterium]
MGNVDYGDLLGSKKKQDKDTSMIRPSATVQGTVGEETPEEYRKAVEATNIKRAEIAKQVGSSALPTPIGQIQGQLSISGSGGKTRELAKKEQYRPRRQAMTLAESVGQERLDRGKGASIADGRMEADRMAVENRAMPATSPAVNMPVESKIMAEEQERVAPGIIAPQPPIVVPTPEPVITMPVPDDQVVVHYQDEGRDRFEEFPENPAKAVAAEPVSTFSADVDTTAYSFVRRALNNGVLPPKDAVRIEEMINYFPYDYALPESREEPFLPNIAVYDSPWKAGNKIMHIGVKGYDTVSESRPRANLVFLLDTSGSMNAPDRLPLLINAMKLLVDKLDPNDTVGIVTYAGRAGTALEPTKVSEKHKIINALEQLRSSGSTAGAAGIQKAYAMAEASFDKNAVNRIILGTDGDFNVGISNPRELQDFVERKRDSGVFLSILGFGQGNFNDRLMQVLAQKGNGHAAYIDTLSEARKVLVEEASSTLFPIAKDVKIQVEFNPNLVSEYRLIGYETRALAREDFNNDAVDAGEIGAGHTVTALYEITPTSVPQNRIIDDLRYGEAGGAAEKAAADTETPQSTEEYAYVKIRYKLPAENTSRLLTRPVTLQDGKAMEALPDDMRFAAAVAGFAQKLRGGRYINNMDYDAIIDLAKSGRGEDEFGYRAEFINLVRLAKSASAMRPQ